MRVTKEAELILNNPYCILGLPCNAEKMDIIKAQEKINKLSKIGAEKSYKTEFYNDLLPEVDRSSGIIQSAMARIDKPESKLFWFVDKHYIQQFSSEDVKNEFLKAEYSEYIRYDCFLANYLFLLLNGNTVSKNVLWEKVFIYIDFLLSSDAPKIMFLFLERFGTETDILQSTISDNILIPMYEFVENSNAKDKLALLDLLKDYNSKEFIRLKDSISEGLVTEIEKECSFVSDYIKTIPNIQKPTKDNLVSASKLANKLIEVAKNTADPLLKSTSIHGTYIDRIKDSFYTEFSKLANVLTYGRSFSNAYACATQANKYAPKHKKTEAEESLELLSELKEAEMKIQNLRDLGQLNYDDNQLLDSSDPSIFMLALRAIGEDAESQLILGSIYNTTTYERKVYMDIPYDTSEGIRWIRKSAEQGYSKAQIALGACYISGKGVQTDISLADMWLRRAVDQGDSEAIRTLTMLESDYRYTALVLRSRSSNLGNPDSSDSKTDNFAWIWILLIVIFIFIVAVASNAGY